MNTKIVTAYWMDVNGYPFQGASNTRKVRYLGSLISHCLGINLPIVCYTHQKNLDELTQLKATYNLDNLEIKLLELRDMKFHQEISRVREINFDGALDGRGPEIMWGKFQVLEQELHDCDYVYWIDVGIQHPGIFPWKYCKQYNKIEEHPVRGPWWAQYDSYNFSSLITTEIFKNLNKIASDKISTIVCTSPQISYPFQEKGIIDYNITRPYPVAGMIGGPSTLMQKYIDTFWEFCRKVLSKNFLCTEECVMKIVFDQIGMHHFFLLSFDIWYGREHDTFHFSDWDHNKDPLKPFYMAWKEILTY